MDPATGRPALEVDDLIIVDNLPAHDGETETALNEFFDDMSVELIASRSFTRLEPSRGMFFRKSNIYCDTV